MTGQALIDTAVTEGRLLIRCRNVKWVNPSAYMRLSVHEGTLGPWAHLFDRDLQERTGEPTPQSVPTFMAPFNLEYFLTTDTFEPWTGPEDPAEGLGGTARVTWQAGPEAPAGPAMRSR